MSREYIHRKIASNSDSVPVQNQFAPRPFKVQLPAEEKDQKPDLETQPETEQPFANFAQMPIFPSGYAPSPSPRVQMKLIIGEVGDQYEQEADRVATEVVSKIHGTENPPVQRQEQPQEDQLQMKATQHQPGEGMMAATPDLEASIQQAQGSGQPIADTIREPMEQAFGADFSKVKIHSDAQSDQLNQSIQAKAFTTGQDIFFRQGTYDPGSRGGQELLAHELTHVVQQNHLAVQATQDRRQVIQRKLAVAVEATAGNNINTVKITNIDIAGRPKHMSFPTSGGGQSEGDHTTAWSVMRLTVLNRLRGKTLETAVKEVDTLVTEAQSMPGAQTSRINAMGSNPGERGKFSDTALTELDNAKGDAATAVTNKDATQVHSKLQNYIAAYLKYRNSIGLSVMHLGRAVSGGEPKALQTLQYWEEKWNDANKPNDTEKGDILIACGVVFSGKVLEEVGNNQATPQNLPGLMSSDNKTKLKTALLTQHRASIRGAFPNIINRLAPSNADLNTVAGNEWTGTVPNAAQEQITGVPFAVQIEVDGSGKIENAYSSGRPKHGTAGSLEGDHTTAYVVSTRTIEKALKGKTLADAKTALDTVEGAFRSLPGAKSERVDRMTEERIAHFKAADTQLTNAKTNADTNATLTTIQQYAGALLYFRNSLALSVVAAESTSKGKGESGRMNKLESIETGMLSGNRFSSEQIEEAIAGLFDNKAINKYSDVTTQLTEEAQIYSPDHTFMDYDAENTQDIWDDISTQAIVTRRDPVPGYLPGEEVEDVFSAVLKQHLLSIQAVAPTVFDSIDEDLLTSIITSLVGDFLVDVDSIVKSLSSLLTKGSTKLVNKGKRSSDSASKITASTSKKSKTNKKGKKSKKKSWDDDSDYEV
ncbi:MAG: DUF4157 domain-containing protein [Nodularia sp. CChRGM 3473]